MKKWYTRQRTFKQNYYQSIGQQQINNCGTQLYSARDNGEGIYNHYDNMVSDVGTYFNDSLEHEHLLSNHKFTQTNPRTGKKYPRGGKGMWRSPYPDVRDKASQQYKYFLNCPTYECGTTWTIEEMLVYFLQAFEDAKAQGRYGPLHKEQIDRTNRMLDHLIAWQPEELAHLEKYKIQVV
tara:strand:+ start:53 stop:592 length:540 start_codon:yes stop_codon:yes gene_type:complete